MTPDFGAEGAFESAVADRRADPERHVRNWADRALWTTVGLGLLWWSWQLVGDSYRAWTVPFLVAANLWGLGTILASWLPDNRWTRNPALRDRWAWATALLTVAVFAAWATVMLTGSREYGTDAIAFDQYAASLVNHGLNPYTHSMAPAFQFFRTPTSYYTYTFTGRPVTALSYPSLSFLLYVPFLALGWINNLAPTLNMVAWGATVLLMFALLPRRVRPAALLFGGYGLYASFAMGGVTDALFMPLLVVAAYRWDRFGQGPRTYIAPVMFGLAMGIKQTPWPALPFILLALACDEHARAGLRAALTRAGRYLAVVLAAFLLPNLPWILADPGAWVRGTLTPLAANMVPTGQGSISLSLYLHLGGGSMLAFTAAAALIMVLLLLAFVGTYPLLRLGMYLLPAFAFAFAARSNVNYFISLLPAGLVAAASAGPAIRRHATERRLFRNRAWLLATTLTGALAAASVVYSLTAQAPMNLRIVGVATTGVTNRIERLSLRVANNSGSAIRPAFDVMTSGFNSTFWLVVSGPRRLAPHTHALYSIASPNAGAEPSAYGGFNVVAYVAHPASFSVSPAYEPELMQLGFDPQAIDTPQRVGRTIRVGVQLYAAGGGPVRRAGVRVEMTSVIWTGTGPQRSAVQINGQPAGDYGVSYTNAAGIAVFRVRSVSPNSYPVSLAASLLNRRFDYTYGNSGDLNIRFVAR